MSVFVVRAFVQIRELLAARRNWRNNWPALEKKLTERLRRA